MVPQKRARRQVDNEDEIVAVEGASSSLREEIVGLIHQSNESQLRSLLILQSSSARKYAFLILALQNPNMHATERRPPTRVKMIPTPRFQT